MMMAEGSDDSARVEIRVLGAPSPDWDDFVATMPAAALYHRSGWTQLARSVFGHTTYFLEARDSTGSLCGILPVVRQRGVLGAFATSIPFFSYGGVLARSNAVALALMSEAREVARRTKCSYLELRDIVPHGGDWQVRTDKVSMILELPDSAEALAKSLGSKLRSQVKRADREQVEVLQGGRELLDDFYAVFAHNMRDLGTPVYPLSFFRAIVDTFPQHVLLVVIRHSGRPAAAGFLLLNQDRAEIPWAACLTEAKPLGMNMKLYWEVLAAVVARGCRSFDFGRSTLDSGPYRFKKQWGAKPLQLHWHRWERDGAAQAQPNIAGEGKAMSMARSLWRKLPLPVANVIGPYISPGLPW